MLKLSFFTCADSVDYLRIDKWIKRANRSTVAAMRPLHIGLHGGYTAVIPETVRNLPTWLSTTKILELPLLNKFCTQNPQYLLQEPPKKLKERL